MNRGFTRGLPRELPGFRGLTVNAQLRSVYLGDGQSPTQTGVDNVIIGDSAGLLLRTSAQTVLIGSQAGQGLDSTEAVRTGNVHIGYQAGQASITSNNTCVGSGAQCGTFGSGGGGSVSIGQGAIANASNGVVVGAGAANQTGTGSVALGSSANAFNGTVSVGYRAGNSQSGSTAINTLVGFQSGYTATSANATTTGTRQTLVGNNTGANTTTQLNDIVCIGDTAQTGGPSSVVVGSAAVGIGSDVNIGYQAGSLNTGVNGVAIGYQAGQSLNTDGVAIGYQAGKIQSNNSVLIGYNAGVVNATNQQVFVGHLAGGLSTTGKNTFLGFQAGYTTSGTNATTTGTGQTCLGSNTGQASPTVVNYITAIGFGVTVGASGGIAIGVDHTNTPATTSVQDEIVLGTTLHGLCLGNLAGSLTATTGFPYMPVTAGAPTGVPAAKTNYVPFQFDSTDGKLWAYYGAAWHYATFT